MSDASRNKKSAIDRINNAKSRAQARGRPRQPGTTPRLVGWLERKVSGGTQVAIPAPTIRSWGTSDVLLADLGYAVIIVPHRGTASAFAKAWNLDHALAEQLRAERGSMPLSEDKDGKKSDEQAESGGD